MIAASGSFKATNCFSQMKLVIVTTLRNIYGAAVKLF